MNNKETLEVGDVIFLEGNYGFLRKMKVERVTETLAFVENETTKLKRQLRQSDWNKDRMVIDKVARRHWESGTYRLSTPELEARFRAKEIIEQLEQQKWREYKLDELETIWKVVANKLAGDIIASNPVK